jgi:hypothetical protein
MARTDRLWLAAIALLTLTARTQAGVLQGSVVNSGDPALARPGDAVVWVEEIPERAERRLTRKPYHWFWQSRTSPRLPRLVQAGRRFTPRVLAVASGGAIVIRNHDGVWHGTFSVSPAAPLELGKRAPGSVDTVRFATPGIVAVRCDIHPDESAFVVVTPNHAFARPDGTGRWQLPELPAGRYVVHVWHPGRSEQQRTVELAEHGTTWVTLRW